MIPKFPQFKPLSIADKHTYIEKVIEYPPYSDILFATLHIWWNLGDKLSVSSLSDNLVINYHQPFDEENTGLGLIGTSEIDASINELFDYLLKSNKKIRLIHVPEFVITSIEKPGRYALKEETDFGEYILDCQALSKLEGHKYYDLRYQVNRFLREVKDKRVELKSIDMGDQDKGREILQNIQLWEKKYPPKNDLELTEHLALQQSLKYSQALDLQNLSIFIDNKMAGIVIYHQPKDKEYYILHHLKVNYDFPYISDFIYHELAKVGFKKGIVYLNIEMDLGIESLKIHKNRLNPVHILKKYEIEPLR